MTWGCLTCPARTSRRPPRNQCHACRGSLRGHYAQQLARRAKPQRRLRKKSSYAVAYAPRRQPPPAPAEQATPLSEPVVQVTSSAPSVPHLSPPPTSSFCRMLWPSESLYDHIVDLMVQSTATEAFRPSEVMMLMSIARGFLERISTPWPCTRTHTAALLLVAVRFHVNTDVVESLHNENPERPRDKRAAVWQFLEREDGIEPLCCIIVSYI
jgi:hypothetical protein